MKDRFLVPMDQRAILHILNDRGHEAPTSSAALCAILFSVACRKITTSLRAPRRMKLLRGKHGQRDEVTEQHGYDTKAAMHMIRMMHEGLELVTRGRMTFPRPEVGLLIQIRRGDFSLAEVKNMYLDLEDTLQTQEQKSSLPRQVDRRKVSDLITDIYLDHWRPPSPFEPVGWLWSQA